MFKSIRQFFCSHTAKTRDIQRINSNRVTVKCEKCGKQLYACYGLALDVEFVK